MVLVASGQEVGQRIDDHQVRPALGLQLLDAVEQSLPFGRRRLAAERLAEVFVPCSESQVYLTFTPTLLRLLRNDGGEARRHGASGQLAAGLALSQQMRQQCRLADLVDARELRDLARPDESVPDPALGLSVEFQFLRLQTLKRLLRHVIS